METRGRPGVVLNIGSAAGIYPSPHDPIYAATKGSSILNLTCCAFHSSYCIYACRISPPILYQIAYHEPDNAIFFFPTGGVVMFSRSLVPYKRQGIRVNVLCPEVRVLLEVIVF